MPTLLRPHALPYAGLSVLVALALAGCGGGSSTTSGPAPAAGSTPAPTGAMGGRNAQRQPGTTGLIAAVSGSTMQVQTRTDQTAVSWTDTTTFTRQVVATLGDVTTGSCVTVLEPQSTGSATGTPGTAAAAPTSVTAATVQVRPATNGQCAGGFAGGAGGGGAGGGGAGAPTGAPTRTGTAGPDGAGGFGRRATNGLVTAVNGSTITVQEVTRGGGGGGAAGGAA
ncbi:MAG: hypothetical protein M3171_14565, partial [Actinomycetota bacterium]|nr:hypothetical protein [Actinomycetota bacterium]